MKLIPIQNQGGVAKSRKDIQLWKLVTQAMLKPIPTIQNLIINLFLALGGVIFFRLISLTSGRISVYGGLGYDGLTYATMLTEGLSVGSPNKQLRPLLILLTHIPYYFTHDIVKSFEIMNYVYVFIFCLSLGLIFDIYNKKIFIKAFFLINILSCVAATKVFAFYPT